MNEKAMLQSIRNGRPLSRWWNNIPEGMEFAGAKLVEKTSSSYLDSYDCRNAGTASMVFLIGDNYYKVTVYHSSYDNMDWDNDNNYPDTGQDSVDIKLVQPRVRRISYYE